MDGDPFGAGEVGGGDDAFGFEELVEALGVGGEAEVGAGEAGAGVVEIDEGEHFSADGFVAYPEDKVVAPLAGFDGVGEGEEEGSKAFGVHGWSIECCLVMGLLCRRSGWLLRGGLCRAGYEAFRLAVTVATA